MDTNTVYPDNDGHLNIPVDSSQPIVLYVNSPNGNVQVRGVSRPDVQVTIEGYDPSDETPAFIRVAAQGNTISVLPDGGQEREPLDLSGDLENVLRRAASWLTRTALRHVDWPDLTIELPRHVACRLEAHTASGDIEVAELSGALTVHSASGDMHLSRLLGQVKLQSASGDISLETSVATLTARTASGDIHVTETVLDGFHAQTASGDCYVEGSLRGSHRVRVETASGDVHFNLEQPEQSGATLSFRTIAGDSHVESPFRRVGQRRWQLGTGEGPQIEVATASGDLHTETSLTSRPMTTEDPARFAEMVRSPAAPEPPAPPAAPEAPAAPSRSDPLAFAPPAPGDNEYLDSTTVDDAPTPQRPPAEAARIALLEAVARGEIDIEEALRRLDSSDVTSA